MSPDRPPAIVFQHLPKTGGLTIRNLLRRQFPPERVYTSAVRTDFSHPYRKYLRGEGPLPPIAADPHQAPMEKLRAMPPEEAAELDVFLGHFWFGVHEEIRRPSVYVSMAREPVDRVLSLYQHRVDRHGLDVSVEEYMDRAFDLQVHDHQTRMLAGPHADYRAGPCTDETLALAKANVERWHAVFGVTERFDETVLMMGRRFGWTDVRYVRENTTSERPRRETLPRSMVSRIEELNRFDAELHAWAAARFAGQVDELGVGAEELARFRERNRRFQARSTGTGLRHRARRALRRLVRAS
jgi:hypothetical protein